MGTDPLNARDDRILNPLDGDRDGLAGVTEDQNANGRVDTGESDPFDADTDGDGVEDGTERAHNLQSDPMSIDTDGDGLPDGLN